MTLAEIINELLRVGFTFDEVKHMTASDLLIASDYFHEKGKQK